MTSDRGGPLNGGALGGLFAYALVITGNGFIAEGESSHLPSRRRFVEEL